MRRYENMSRRAESMTRDEILSAIESAGQEPGYGVPSLSGIYERMIDVEALAEVYHGREGWDTTYLVEALMQAHERFRGWIGVYS